MSIEKPQPGMLVIQCDLCVDHLDFHADEGSPGYADSGDCPLGTIRW